MRLTRPLSLIVATLICNQANAQVSVAANHDAAIYSESGSVANGAGSFLFSGANSSGNIRRSLLSFDISGALPAGSQINSVTLQLNCNQASSPSEVATLHRALAAWSEGLSDPSGSEGSGTAASAGDVTWTERNFGAALPWSIPGGEFVASASSTVTVAGLGLVVFPSTAQLVLDVQGWLDSPATNLGWVLRSNEATPSSARRYDSRQGTSALLAPALLINFTAGCSAPTTYCVLSPNSAGPGATIASSGSTSIAQHSFVLTASGCPPATNGLFYFGTQTTLLPFGDGSRCVGGILHRLSALSTNANGDALHAVDFTSGSGANILAGSACNFQFWFRDSAAAGSGFNLSNGLSATFCP